MLVFGPVKYQKKMSEPPEQCEEEKKTKKKGKIEEKFRALDYII